MKKYLIGGLPSGGKTKFANKLENELNKYIKVVNKDVDYDLDWSIPDDNGVGVFILQTPHGSQTRKEDGINPKDFDRIINIEPSFGEYARRLAKRSRRWFKDGRTHIPEYRFNVPYCPLNLVPIFYSTVRWLAKRRKFIEEDVKYFEGIGIPLTRVKSDDKIIEDLVEEVKWV